MTDPKNLSAGNGNDMLIAEHRVTLTGSAGSDIFQFDYLPSQADDSAKNGYSSFASDGAGSVKIYFDRDDVGTSASAIQTELVSHRSETSAALPNR